MLGKYGLEYMVIENGITKTLISKSKYDLQTGYPKAFTFLMSKSIIKQLGERN